MRRLWTVALLIALVAAAAPAMAAAPAPWKARYARCAKGVKAGPYCPDVYLGDFGQQLRFMLQRGYCPHLPYLKASGSWAFTPSLKVRKGKFDQTYVYDSLIASARNDPGEWQVTFRLKGTFTAKTLRVAITGTVTRDNDGLNDCKDVHIKETHVLKQKVF